MSSTHYFLPLNQLSFHVRTFIPTLSALFSGILFPEYYRVFHIHVHLPPKISKRYMRKKVFFSETILSVPKHDIGIHVLANFIHCSSVY